MLIESYSFGKISINGKIYHSDVIIFPDRVYDSWWRKEGHILHLEDLKAAPRKSENGGQVMSARLLKDDDQRTVTTGKDGGFDWWESISRKE